MVLLIGLVLRVLQLARRPSLWLDEALLAVNIVSRPARALIFSPLDRYLIAPPGYLQAEKLVVSLLGPSELALRLPAFLFSCAALIIIALICRRLLDRSEQLFAVGLLALSPMLLIYSAETKQYGVDVFAAVSLTWMTFELRASHYSRKWVVIAATVGLMIVWLSDPAALMLGGLGIAIVVLAFLERDRRALKAAMFVAPVWIAAVVLSRIGAKRRLVGGTQQIMTSLWDQLFVPFPPRTVEELLWLPNRMMITYTKGFSARFAGVVAIVSLLGILAMWRKGRRDLVLILFLPVLVSLTVSAARLYPFAGRVILFLYPAFAIAFACGAAWIANRTKRAKWVALAALFVLLISPPQWALIGQPPPGGRSGDIRPALSHLRSHMIPGDRVYVYWEAAPQMTFYGTRYGIRTGDWTAGASAGDDWRPYIDEIRRCCASARTWIIFAHDVRPALRDTVFMQLDEIGARDSSESFPADTAAREDAIVRLYDLGQ
jgi:uncharacterized membrane protein